MQDMIQLVHRIVNMKKAPPKSSGKPFQMCIDTVISLPFYQSLLHMPLPRLSRWAFSLWKIPDAERPPNPSFQTYRDMFNVSGTGISIDPDGERCTDMIFKPDIRIAWRIGFLGKHSKNV